jgi:hypothetical protein
MAVSTLRFNKHIVTGTLNGVSATSVTGTTLFQGTSFLKVDNLTAYLIVTAATSSLTVTPYWQVSDDGTTFKSMHALANVPINLPIATATENVTEVLPAPKGIEGYRYARCMLLVGGATGGAADLYSIGYSYRQNFQ